MSRRRRPRRGGNPTLLVWLVAGLAVLAFLQSIAIYPWLTRRRRVGDEHPVPEVNLPEREVRVLAFDGDLSLILKTPLDLPTADRLDVEALDRQLFPGGESHRYLVLHITNGGEEERSLDPVDPPLVLLDAEGREHTPVDLAGVLDSRAASLPAYLVPRLRLRVLAGGRIAIPPGASRAVLLAYGSAPPFQDIAGARLGDRVLEPRNYRKDALDGELETPDAHLRAKRP